MLCMDHTASCQSACESAVEQLAKVMRVHHFRAVSSELLHQSNQWAKVPFAVSRKRPARNAVSPEEVRQGTVSVHGIERTRIVTVREPKRQPSGKGF